MKLRFTSNKWHNEWIVLLGGWKYYVDISILLHVHAHEHIHTPIYPVSSHVLRCLLDMWYGEYHAVQCICIFAFAKPQIAK